MSLKTETATGTGIKIEAVCKNLLCGGIAGMVSKTAVAPLDRVKILLQAHSRHHESHGVWSGFKHVSRREGILALYKVYSISEIYKKLLDGIFGEMSHIDKFLAGAGAGLTSVTLTYPLDTIRARLAFQITGEHLYSGIAHAASTIFKEEGGIRALYRGFTPTLMGMVPYAGLSFYCFEYLKFGCMKYLPRLTCKPYDKNTGGLVLSVPAKLICGGLAGAVAQSVSYPLDVTRRRMQLAMMNPDTHHFAKGMFSTLGKIYGDHGIIKGLYRGMSINYMRAIPMVAVSFSTYELCKQIMNLDTGLKV
ncbi:hypothetical protein NQ317_007360 [Molorchus minor]|uniref:Graves disease carrier protein n=1 Tax=Molorchus minor TaxID=1323400 RepID=A0ABQ9JBC7_9CUCU|nr:hypothetical protein NQ317_007360 [Molorchus minor]